MKSSKNTNRIQFPATGSSYRNPIVYLGFVALVLIAIAFPAYGASFNCAKSETSAEKLICADSNLSDLDGKLADLYQELRNSTNLLNRGALEKEESDWLHSVRDKCTDSACLSNAYTERLEKLSSVDDKDPKAEYIYRSDEKSHVSSMLQKSIQFYNIGAQLDSCGLSVAVGSKIDHWALTHDNTEYSVAALCQMHQRLVMVCDDSMVGRMTIKVTGFTGNGQALADFARRNCPAGG